MSDANATVTRVIEVDVKASQNAAQHLKQIADGMRGMEEHAASARSSMGQFFDFMTTGVKAFAGMFVAGEVTKLILEINKLNDESKVLSGRLKLVTTDSLAAADALLEVTRIAREQGRDVDSTARLYEKAARNQEQLGITTRGVALLTEGFAASLRISGSSAQEATASMIQFGQVIASGRFQGDEFRSILENDSVFMYELAKAAGVTMQKLREMSKDGKLNAEFLRETLFKLGEDGTNMLQRLIDKADTLPKTFEQAILGVKASFVELLSAMNETAGQAEGLFTRMAKAVSSGLSKAAQAIHEETIVANAVLEAQGKEVPKLETPQDQRMKEDLALANRRYQVLQQMHAAEEKLAAIRKNVGSDVSRIRGEVKAMEDSIVRFKGELIGLDRVLEDRERKTDQKQQGFTVPGWKPQPDDSKKKKGGSEGTDWVAKIQKEIAEATALADLTDDEGFVGPVRKKLEQELVRMALDDDANLKKYSVSFMDNFVKNMREQADALDRRKLDLDFDKFLNKVLVADNERQIQKVIDKEKADREKVAQALKLHARMNPLYDDEQLVADFRRLALDKNLTTDEEAEKLFDLIHDIREKAAKKLLGEKDPLRDVAMQMGDAFEDATKHMIDDLLSFNKSGKEIVGDFVYYVLKEFAKIEMSQAFQPLLAAGKDFIGGLIKSWLGSANGSAFSAGGVRLFGTGDVVNAPTGFSYNGGQNAGVMGEAGPEAIMPLRRGADGKLGVGAAPVTVTVINNTQNGQARTEERRDSNGNREIVVVVEDIVDNAIGRGRFDRSLSSMFGVNRKGR